MAAGIAEIFPDGGTGERCIILKGGRVGSSGSDDDGIVHRPFFGKSVDDIGDGGAFLAYGHIYAIYRIPGQICLSLIDDCIKSYGCFSCLTVADDEFPLSPSDRNHGVDGFNARLKRLCHRLTEDDTGCLPFKGHLHQFTGDFPPAVERLP